MAAHILLIEDTQSLAETIADILHMEGFKVTIAGNGAEGLRMLEPLPDIIITDLLMPEMDGIEFIRNVRLQRRINTPIIVLSARVTEESIQEGMDAGANLFLGKPFDADRLLDSIHTLLTNEQIRKN
jgi:two-component system, chemotaxis family, chemotaxis protein CheY